MWPPKAEAEGRRKRLSQKLCCDNLNGIVRVIFQTSNQSFQSHWQRKHSNLISQVLLIIIEQLQNEGFVSSFVCCLHRENILVLDIFFEALNYETIEQKKAYEVAGLLGIASFLLYNIDCLRFFVFMHLLWICFHFRWYWWSDGTFYWCKYTDYSGDIWLPLWGKT